MIKNDIRVVLIGKPNSGKSTIFNVLTGSNQHVGNYSGVTVEKKEGFKKYHGYKIFFFDLPGIYSFFSYSEDEMITKKFLLEEKFDVILNIVDSVDIEHSLYLFSQIIEINVPIIMILNMCDVLKNKGKEIDGKIMSTILGVPVISTIANKKIGTDNIFNNIISSFKNINNTNTRVKIVFNNIIEKEIDKIISLIPNNIQLTKFSKKFISIELLENDEFALKLISKFYNRDIILDQIMKSKKFIEMFFNKKIESEIANTRYNFAKSVIEKTIKKIYLKKTNITDIIDSFVLNKYFGLIFFSFVVYIIFKITFIFSKPISSLLALFFKFIENYVSLFITQEIIRSLVVDGIISGISGVLNFFPIVLFMFFAIGFFEDSGYMSRVVIVMDKIMSKFGLNGKSFLPFMLSTNGCAVPAILSTRILDSKRDRLITMFIVPFMICGAKLPIFALIISVFFNVKYHAFIMFSMYVVSVVIALIVAKLLGKTILRGDSTNFVIELPEYHLPTIKSLFLKMWGRSLLYLKKASSIIIFISIIVWFLFSFPRIPKNSIYNDCLNYKMNYSFAGRIVKIFNPLFKPIGMDGDKAISLMAGFAAKEVIVSTLNTIYNIQNGNDRQSLKEKIALDKNWSPLKGISFLIFCLIYTPCITSVCVFFKETFSNYKLTTLFIIGNTIFAWISSFVVFQIGMLLKIGI
ncbi:MAG: ferrous iron transport protein B [Endomicrobium sp.]|jgi:ferrous iron transport protein B|nr:ferrous iron transport protein B [Endomicrobium sp.]